MHDLRRAIGIGLLLFTVFLATCVALRPEGLWVNDGISYYGALSQTLIPYGLAFALFAGFLLQAAAISARAGQPGYFGRFFQFSAFLLLGLAITPHNIPPFDRLHVGFGSALFGLDLIMAIVVCVTLRRARNWVLLGAMFLAGLACLYYLHPKYGFEIEFQVVYQVAFWTLFLGSTSRSSEDTPAAPRLPQP